MVSERGTHCDPGDGVQRAAFVRLGRANKLQTLVLMPDRQLPNAYHSGN